MCCNLLGSLELALSHGMVRSTSTELGARSNAKRGLGSLEMFRGDFFSFSKVLQFFSFICLFWDLSLFSVVTVSDDGIFGYSVN